MTGLSRLALVAALVCGAASAPALAQESTSDDRALPYATGAMPIGPEAYAKLPKMKRHRAWLPKSIDLTQAFPVPGSQGSEPNCVAWAVTYAARSYLAGQALGRRLTPTEAMSPAYVYNRLRPPGTVCWGMIRFTDVLTLLKEEGTVPIATFPDEILKCKIPASETLRTEAAAYRIGDWRAAAREVPDDWRTPLVLDDVKGALARGVPVVFAMPVGSAFMGFKGVGNFHADTSPGTNYHAMAIVGYDEDRQAFRIMNSWGTRWADGGYAWIDYATFKLLAAEAYALEAPDAKPATMSASPQEALAGQLATLQCGSVTTRTEAGHVVVEGFGGVKASLDDLRAAALAAAPDTQWRVAYHPWPQCEAETTLVQPLHTGGVTLAAATETGPLRDGDPVAMRAGEIFGVVASSTADKPYLSIVYLQADGSAVELYRGQPQPGADGKRQVVLGTSGPAQTRFQVGPPYGDEVLIALASSAPLFGPELKTYATERQFLTALRAHLLAAPKGGVAAQVLRLRTSAG